MKDETKPTFSSNLKEIAFFIAIYLYFIGFTYVYYYYEEFGISLRALETPVYFFFVFSYNVLQNLPSVRWSDVVLTPTIRVEVLALYLLLLVSMTVGWRRFRRVLVILLLTALFPFFAAVASLTAKVEARKTRSGSQGVKEITFLLKTDSADLLALKRLRTLEAEGSSKTIDGGTAVASLGTAPAQTTPAPAPASSPTSHETDAETAAKLMSPAELNDFTRFVQANGRKEGEEVGELYYHKLYLLTETSTSFYVLLQPRSDAFLPAGYVYQVPKSAVLLSSVRIQ